MVTIIRFPISLERRAIDHSNWLTKTSQSKKKKESRIFLASNSTQLWTHSTLKLNNGAQCNKCNKCRPPLRSWRVTRQGNCIRRFVFNDSELSSIFLPSPPWNRSQGGLNPPVSKFSTGDHHFTPTFTRNKRNRFIYEDRISIRWGHWLYYYYYYSITFASHATEE